MNKTRWIVAVTFIVFIWLVFMAGASYFGYENKLPVRIENWRPEPAR